MRSDVLVMAAALAVTHVEAFWGTGHLIVSRRAQDLLQSQDNAAYQAVLDELAPLKASNPDLTTDEGEHPMTECATFADNIKGEGYSFQSGWHFIDQPYLDQGGTLADYPDFEMDEYDTVGAMTSLSEWLKNEGTSYQSSYYYKTIKSYFPDEDEARSFALRLLIHYVGDIHQPLHATSLVDSSYPEGDAGGNFEHLPSRCGASNLHAVWDSVGYLYCGYPTLPLSDNNWILLTQTEQSIAHNFSVDKSKIYDGEFQTWATESFDLAKSVVYPGYHGYETLTDEYITQVQDTLQSRLMYGGYRLSDLLKSIYGSSSEELDLAIEQL